jgi:hypothetical protein
MTSIRQAAGCCMDLVQLEDAVEKPMVSGLASVSSSSSVLVVVLSSQGEEVESRCATVCPVDRKDTNSPRNMQREMRHRHAFGWTYRDSSCLLEILQLSFFLHNSNFFLQPSSLRVQRREQLTAKL